MTVEESLQVARMDPEDRLESIRIPLFPCAIQIIRKSQKLFSERFGSSSFNSEMQVSEFLFRENKDTWCFQWGDRFEFQVDVHQNRIFLWASQKESAEGVLDYLLYHMASFFWLKIGMEPLHGSAFLFQGKVWALLGDSGFGKSTLLAYALSQGAKIISDDVILLDSQLRIHPTWARIKLFPESALLIGNRDHAPILFGHQKSIYKLNPEEGVASSFPISSIFILNNPFLGSPPKNEPLKLESLSKTEAHLGLLENSFNTYVQTPERWARQFQIFSNWAKCLSIQRLTFPRDLEALPRVFAETFMTSRTAPTPTL